MSTEAQINANRQNSQKSTGPTTVEGKAVVSQNAVKHGLFAAEAVISLENPAEYELYRQQFLAELLPVGMLESMLAERIVSLAWRLRRAERMQNETIEVLIARIETDSWEKTLRERAAKAQDPRAGGLELLLGWATKDDFSDTRILDRLMLYERRIENSLHKSIIRLKQYQVVRKVEKEDPNQQRPAPEARHPAKNLDDLKKQSQFAAAHLTAMPCMEGGYDNNPAGGYEENKPNQACPEPVERSQFIPDVPADGPRIRDKSAPAAAG